MTKKILEEISKRRTFGIISHPDAGKTTLTEKLLLFGGAIQQAGAIKSRKTDKHATSDWMAVEQERGISVTTSVMKFNYNNFEINLLDTPGHKDFSEDTYRVLTAVDSALMIIDSGKGVEPQTEKLMEVCRMRNTPIITFINKMDREGLPTLDILSEIEDKLQIECTPLSWPIGMGKEFKGVYNFIDKSILLFKAGQDKKPEDVISITDLNDPVLDELLGSLADRLREDVELIEGAADPFSMELFLNGTQTPVFFGSALNNFGVHEVLEALINYAPAPGPRATDSRLVNPAEENFTGFAFKIQANMDPAHRDRIAFIRVCSGKFEKGMKVKHHRIEKDIVFANAITFMARERSHIEEAYPGDIIGIHNHGTIKIGDTFSIKEPLKFTGIPNFAPELFKRVVLKNPLKAKQLNKGLIQLSEEGAIQFFKPMQGNDIILGAVGELQFDVTIGRLKSEYSVDAIYESINYSVARWLKFPDEKMEKEFEKKNYSNMALDSQGFKIFLSTSEWQLGFIKEKWPDVIFLKTMEHI